MDIPALGEENPAKNFVENDKKLRMVLVQIGERKKEFEKVLNESNLTFKKAYSRVLINRKSVSINRNRQKLTKNFICNFN